MFRTYYKLNFFCIALPFPNLWALGFATFKHIHTNTSVFSITLIFEITFSQVG